MISDEQFALWLDEQIELMRVLFRLADKSTDPEQAILRQQLNVYHGEPEKPGIAVYVLDDFPYNDHVRRSIMFRLGVRIRQDCPQMLAAFFISETWHVVARQGERSGVQPKDDPRREERIVVMATTLDERRAIAALSVERDEHGWPRLGALRRQAFDAEHPPQFKSHLLDHLLAGYCYEPKARA